MRKITVISLPDIRAWLVLLLMLAVLTTIRFWPVPEIVPALAPAMLGQVIVIDPGHGGIDPGMVGESGNNEATINLAVALKLAEYCRAAGAEVTLTRESESALATSKSEDMQARVELTRAAEADLFISLHCNSFTSGRSQHGAQVFYQRSNAQGQLLAETLQAELSRILGNTERVALPHPDSYLLRNLEQPTVICEMGFLSNAEEDALLNDSEYQWQMAWAVFSGINQYFINADNVTVPEK
jgi:N-acetylmuramoyl-L-alanine amidase